MTSNCMQCAFLSLAALLLLSSPSEAQEDAHAIQFERFPVEVYRGPTKIPKGLYKDSDGMWRDELGKWALPPDVNFAGEYWLAAHSCGTGCRYYQLIDLRSGEDIQQVSMFDAGDPPPQTRDGHTYIPILVFKPDSKLLVVQYEIDSDTPGKKEQCRQRYYAFDDGRFKAISKTLPSCTRMGGTTH